MDSEIAWDDCLPDLPLDNHHLPPLNALSNCSSHDLSQLQLLDLFSIDSSAQEPSLVEKDQHVHPQPSHHLNLTSLEAEKLSTCTSTTPSLSSQDDLPTKPSSPISHNARSTTSSPQLSPKQPCKSSLPDKQDQLDELALRLKAAGTETTALRKRVAALTAENRGLRAALDHANARLVAVAQAAAAHPPPSTQPLVVGLAQVSTDVASRLGAALTVSDTTASAESEPNRKKRKRVAGAATTMACVMFMWGALVGTPGLLKGSNYRSEGNLPAVWNSQDSGAVAPTIPRLSENVRATGWQPNCMRVLKQLPNGSEDDEEEAKEESKVVKEEETLVHEPGQHEVGSAMFVDVEDKAVGKVVARSDVGNKPHPEYSYVLCRDAASALDSVKSCATRMRRGESCGQPHTISLIVPAAAAGIEDNETREEPGLAEVHCSILSVARIPGVGRGSKFGRVIATVPERMDVGTTK